MKTHSGEKSNKCNQYDFASSWADILRIHRNTHSGEKFNNFISEFIGMLYNHVNLQSDFQKELIMAIIAVNCISEFIGIFYNHVHLQSGCQRELILAIIAVT